MPEGRPMKSSICALATAIAAMGAWAQPAAVDLPALLMVPAPSFKLPEEPHAAAARTHGGRPAMFAPGAVAGATRLTPEVREQRRFIRDAAAESRFELEASKLAMTK